MFEIDFNPPHFSRPRMTLIKNTISDGCSTGGMDWIGIGMGMDISGWGEVRAPYGAKNLFEGYLSDPLKYEKFVKEES